MMKKTIATGDKGRKTLVVTTRDHTVVSKTLGETAEEAEVEAAATTTEVVTAGAITEATMIEIKETTDQSLAMIETEVPKQVTITHRLKTRRESYM